MTRIGHTFDTVQARWKEWSAPKRQGIGFLPFASSEGVRRMYGMEWDGDPQHLTDQLSQESYSSREEQVVFNGAGFPN